MPNHARSHEEARKNVCVICFHKVKNGRVVNSSLEEKIKNFIEDYSVLNKSYPIVTCDSCRKKLQGGTLSETFNYEEADTAPSNIMPCNCELCIVAKSNQYEYIKTLNLKPKKRGRPSSSSGVTDKENEGVKKVC